MPSTSRIAAASVAALVLVAALGFPVQSTHGVDGRVTTGSDRPGATTTYTVVVTVDEELETGLTSLALSHHRPTFEGVDSGDLAVAGIDRGGDDPGNATDVSLLDRIAEDRSDEDEVAVELSETVSIDPGDELVVTVRNVTNPPERTVGEVAVTAGSTGECGAYYGATLEIGPDRPFLQNPNLTHPRNRVSDGKSVDVFLPDGGFVAVDLVRDGESIGRVGATSNLAAGPHPAVWVPLNVTPEDGDRLVATLYRDSNGNGLLDGNDRPYRRNGTPVRETAAVDLGPAVTTTADPGTPDCTPVGSRTAQPGFGVLAATVAVLLGLLVVRRRR